MSTSSSFGVVSSGAFSTVTDARPTLPSDRPGRGTWRFVRTRRRTTGFCGRCVVRPATIRARDHDRYDDDRQREQNARDERVRSRPTAAAAAAAAGRRRRPAAVGEARCAPSPTFVVVQLSVDDVVVPFGYRHYDCGSRVSRSNGSYPRVDFHSVRVSTGNRPLTTLFEISRNPIVRIQWLRR